MVFTIWSTPNRPAHAEGSQYPPQVQALLSAICHQSAADGSQLHYSMPGLLLEPPPPHYLHWKTVWTESIYFANDAFHFLYSFDFLHVPTGWTPRWIIRLSDYIVSPPKCPRLRAIKVEYGLEQVLLTFQLNAVLFQFKNIDKFCVTNDHLSWFDSNVCLLENLTNLLLPLTLKYFASITENEYLYGHLCSFIIF